MKKPSNIFTTSISYFFILLFVYASISKLIDFENFQVQIAQSPLLSAYAGFISWAVIAVELIISLMLSVKKWRLLGLYCSFGLMTAFTAYIYLILNYSDFVPCSCGGILEKLGWKEHLIFNVGCIVSLVAILTVKEGKIYKKVLYSLITIFIGSNGLTIFLFLLSEHIIKKENNFTRRFLPHPISDETALNLTANSFYFAGNNGDTIFLGNREAPLLLTTVSPAFKTAEKDTLKLSNDQLPFKSVEVNINYPFISLTDGTVPVIFEGQLPNLLAKQVNFKPSFFTAIKLTSPHNYIFKAVLTKDKKAVLGTVNTLENRVQFNHNLLEEQIDGLFDTDGSYTVDPIKQKIIYTYLYQNQYLVTDLDLENKNIGNTIDTIKKANIKLHKLSDGTIKMAAPPLEVNQFQMAYDGLLFNASALRGKHESNSRWKNSKVIDVYDYHEKTYKYSFYIHNRNNINARSILVTKKYLYALIGNELVRYQRRR